MKRKLLFVFLILSLSTFGQLKFPKDTITNFSLNYVASGGGRDNHYSVDISSTGKIKVVFQIIGGEAVGKKDIQIDANTFRQFKNFIISDAKIYSFPDSISGKSYDCPTEIIIVKSNFGKKKIIADRCPELGDEVFKSIISEITDLVGTVGDDHDAK